MKDFTSTKNTPREFMIDDDVFTCAPRLPAGVGATFAKMAKAPPEDQFDFIGTVLDTFLFPESAELFARRMSDPVHPIDIEQIEELMTWLVEEYTGRPTRPPSDSAPSPNGTGTSSTDGVPPEVAIPEPSTSIGS